MGWQTRVQFLAETEILLCRVLIMVYFTCRITSFLEFVHHPVFKTYRIPETGLVSIQRGWEQLSWYTWEGGTPSFYFRIATDPVFKICVTLWHQIINKIQKNQVIPLNPWWHSVYIWGPFKTLKQILSQKFLWPEHEITQLICGPLPTWCVSEADHVCVSVHLSVPAYFYVHMHVWMGKCIHTFVKFWKQQQQQRRRQ